jgi:hypothetical protein
LSAIASVVPRTDIALCATAAPFVIPGQNQSALAVVLQVELPVRPAATRIADTVDVQVNAYDASGKLRGSDAAKVSVSVTPEMEGTIS